MPRIEVNRSGEMQAFVQVVDRGSFSAGARVLGMTPSAVSKLVARLEARLATQPSPAYLERYGTPQKLEAHNRIGSIHAVYLGKAGRLPARVRAVLDYLALRLADPKIGRPSHSPP